MATDTPEKLAAPPLSFSLWFRLSLMMFLQYAIWGAWLPLLFPFLAGHRGFTPGQIGDMFAVGALGAILAPWIAGQIADRYFNTERYLAVAHILGGVLVFQLAYLDTYWAFLTFSFLYSLIYAPTLSLTNSISFHHLPDRDRDFGRVRVWGTVGWIVVGIGVGQWLAFNHTPDREDVERAMIVNLLDDAKRAELKQSFEVKYLDEDGVAQTAIGPCEQSDLPYLDARAEGEELPERKSVTINTGTQAEPAQTSIDTSQITSVVNSLESWESTLQPELREEFYQAVDAVAGRETPHNPDTADPAETWIPSQWDGTKEEFADAVAKRITERAPRQDVAASEKGGLFTEDAVKLQVSSAQQAGMSDAFIVSALLGVVLGLFCLTLPRTPPQPGQQSNATSEALGEIRRQPLLALFLLAVPISCVHQFYFVHASTFLGEYQRHAEGFVAGINSIFGVGGGGLMTIGQMTEIAVLALIPLFAKKFSRKTLLATGIIAYGLRMFLFAYVDVIPLPPLFTLILGVALHGLCFGSFIFVAFMIVDEETTGDVRASAQSLFNLVIVGIGIIVGSKVAGWVAEWASASGAMNYRQLFSVPMWASVGCLAFLIFFYPRKSPQLAAKTQDA
ncbi:MAG: MFS transporter [Pirellulales bacterium]|nr:MFS transporter [Pirellulales bacterium]